MSLQNRQTTKSAEKDVLCTYSKRARKRVTVVIMAHLCRDQIKDFLSAVTPLGRTKADTADIKSAPRHGGGHRADKNLSAEGGHLVGHDRVRPPEADIFLHLAYMGGNVFVTRRRTFIEN